MKHLFLLFLISWLISNSQINHAQTVITIAGTGSPGFSGDGGQATNASIHGCTNVATDKFGNLYFSDLGNYRIRKVSKTGIISTLAGTGTPGYNGDILQATLTQISCPAGIVADTFGNIFFADAGNNMIRKIAPSGLVTTVAGTGVSGFWGDNGLAINAHLNFPTSIAFDKNGNLLIADTYNNCIRWILRDSIYTLAGWGGYPGGFSGDGSLANGAQLNQPTGLATDWIGNIYFADELNYRIRRIKISDYTIMTLAGDTAAGYNGDEIYCYDANLNFPSGVAIDNKNKRIFIADANNQRIRYVDISLTIHTYAGNGTSGFSGDNGYAPLAEFNTPRGIALDTAGNIFVADYGNNRIRKIIYSDNVFIANEPKNSFLIYPNPTTDYMTIMGEPGKYELFDILGRKIESYIKPEKNDMKIDMSHLTNGMYYIQASNTTGRTEVKKIILLK